LQSSQEKVQRLDGSGVEWFARQLVAVIHDTLRYSPPPAKAGNPEKVFPYDPVTESCKSFPLRGASNYK
jgi:hypothetical protein